MSGDMTQCAERDFVEVRCGYGNCRPKVLQKVNNSKALLFVMSFYVFVQGFIVNGVYNVIVSTLERRFQLRSTQIGLAASAYDFSAAFFGIIVSYLGSGRYKARWLTISAIFMILGSVIMAIPHFTTDLYEWGEHAKSTCDTSGNNSTSKATCLSSGLQNYVAVFALSNILFGIGGATLYTVGTAYIDDSVTSLVSPLYMGIYFGFSALGPGVGYLTGGAFLSFYVDFNKVGSKQVNLKTTDNRWVGAWWVAPLLSAILFMFPAVALSCFGAELPTSKLIRESRESQLHKGTPRKVKYVDPARPALKTVHQVYITLLRNPPFLFTTLAGIMEAMYISGLSVFSAKYVQNAFRLSSGRAGVLTGSAIILGLAGGIAFGGIVCRCFRLKVKGMLKFSFGVCLISTLCIPKVWMSCGQTTLAGVHLPYKGSTDVSLHDECNSMCGCTTERFELSCDSTGVQYFSPCFAGCTNIANTSSESRFTKYSNCSCVQTSANITTPIVTRGSCESSCRLVYGFLLLMFIYAFTTIATDVPAEQAVLRSIQDNHKTIMCGANRLFIRLLGTFPGAVIMGVATDAGCLLWQTECGENTSCWLYDIHTVSRNYFIFGMITKIFSLFFFFCAHRLYEPPQCVDYELQVQKYTPLCQENEKAEGDEL